MTTIDLPTGSLEGIKVIDLGRVLGAPFCTQILGDHGAEIIKIEPPAGDETRGWGPPFNDDGLSAYFCGVNRNKRSVGLDLGTVDGKQVLIRLLKDADIVIDNFKPGTLEKWGLDYETVLKPRFPGLIQCQLTGFGATGPLGGLPGYDIIVQAMAGMLSVNGAEESGPLRIGIPLVDMGTGLNAVIGILLALYRRSVTGEGQSVKVSLYDCAVSLLHPHMANFLMSGKTPVITGNSHPNISPCDLYETATKPIILMAGNNRQFSKFATELGISDILEDPRFVDNDSRVKNRAELNATILDAIKDIDGVALAEQLMGSGVVAGALLDIAEVVAHPHTQQTQMVVEIDEYRGSGIPIKMHTTPGTIRSLPPDYGSSSIEVLTELGYDANEIVALQKCGTLLTSPKK